MLYLTWNNSKDYRNYFKKIFCKRCTLYLFSNQVKSKGCYMGNIGFTEILILVFILVLLFGGKRIPELAKGLGKGIRSFKKALKGEEEEKSDKE